MGHSIGKLFSSLRARLTCLILLVMLPVMLGLVTSLDWVVSARIRAAGEQRLRFEAQDLSSRVQQWDHDAALAVQSIAKLPGILRMDTDEQRQILRALAQLHPQFDSIKVNLPNGRTTVRSDDEPLMSFGDRQWLRGIVDGAALTRQTLVGRQIDQPVTVYGAPLRDPEGGLLGIVSATADLKDLCKYVPTANLGQTGYRFVVERDGRVVAHQDVSLVQQLRSLGDFPPVQAFSLEDRNGAFAFHDSDGTRWLAYIERLPTGWGVISLQAEHEILAEVRQFRQYEMAGATVAGLLAALLTWLVASHVVGPIRALTCLAGEVAAGHMDRRAPQRSQDEVGQLARSFNQMVSRLESDYRNIELKVERRTQALRLRNTELQRARQAAEQEARLKDDFLANMSHEIRTPLTAILGYAELLVDLPMSEEERSKALQAIQYNSQHLLNIINDVLDVAKIEANKMEVECIEFPPVLLINDVISLMRSKANEKGLQLGVQFLNDLPEQVSSDPTRLRQILLNLIGNAIKYTHQGSVKLLVRLIEAGTEGLNGTYHDAMLQFQVTDSGIGIEPDQMQRLFKPFSQGSASTSRQYGGSGLGLVISQKLARLLGGDITVESVFGEGSTFTFTIKIGSVVGVRRVNPNAQLHDTVAALPFVDDEHASALSGIRVLVADDTPSTRDIIVTVLRTAGATVAQVANGHQACHEAMEAFQSGKPYHVVLLDAQMPEMDGLTAASKLRELGYPGPIIALTASLTDAERERCTKAGYNDFARKPLERARLIALVAQWSLEPQGSANTRLATQPGAPTATGSKLRLIPT